MTMRGWHVTVSVVARDHPRRWTLGVKHLPGVLCLGVVTCEGQQVASQIMWLPIYSRAVAATWSVCISVHARPSRLATVTPRSSPGACTGAKADPTRLRIADVSESSVDPLARAVRHRLKRAHGIGSGVPILLSTEKPRCGLVSAEGANLVDYQACAPLCSS